ncbi:RHS repeat domain-containing protein [Pseudomonas fluorescens]|uniref:RHS repeat domain-containing protein n=1 Tax=Pseudomonas fluorescens TaxID=294 RepID=UPI003C2088FC
MQARTPSIHRHTPTLTATDPRRHAVRSVEYYRAGVSDSANARVNHTLRDPAGRATDQSDPRLFPLTSAPANLSTIHGLSGTVLCTISVDAGLRLGLFGESGQLLHSWDGRGSRRCMEYDNQLRLSALFEQARDGEAVCSERLNYGASDQAAAERNQCGQLIRHDDPAGTQRFAEFGLHGGVLEQARRFLKDLSLPDWPESIVDRDLMLEPGEGATNRSQVNAAGDVVKQTDAKGHRQLFHQTLDGQLREVRLQLNGVPTPKTLLSAITYNAHGQTEREVAGNDVITTLEYDAQNERLTRLLAQRGNEALQDLRYAYDPVCNVLSIEDAALPIRYFANQRIEPVNRYAYDSLSQLIEATGWEAGGANKGPQFSTFDDPAPRANYRQTYHYDTGSNLLELTHEGPQSHGHRLVAAAHSNRCLPVLEGVEPDEEDFRRGFDGNGNLLNLQPGQALAWDLRNQLGEVRPVERDSGLNDRERYVYGADGMRLRKVREAHTNARTLIAETRYLPNLELRNHSGTGEVLQVISVQAGRSSVRVLHWDSAPPKGSADDQYRYHLNDHLGSCTLELDEDGEVISQERYHPYGTTAWFAGRGEVEASYRTVRYSGKERDATGLYYYGFRYYLAGWQRWLNPGPAGGVDGLNIYQFSINSPLVYIDKYGETVYHFKDMRFSKTSNVKGEVVVNFDFPGLSLSDASGFYLERSKSGNSFSGVVDIETGQVDIYPLSLTRRDRLIRSDWARSYDGDLHDQGAPIVHSERDLDGVLRVAHVQLMEKLGKREDQLIGFTLNDLSHLRLDGLDFEEVAQNTDTSIIYGASRSLNTSKIGLIVSSNSFAEKSRYLDLANSSTFKGGGVVAGGTNLETFNLNRERIVPFFHLPIEFKQEIGRLFFESESIAPRLRSALQFELLHRDDMQVTPPSTTMMVRRGPATERRWGSFF